MTFSGFILYPVGKVHYGKISTIDVDLLAFKWQYSKYIYRHTENARKTFRLHRIIMERVLNRPLLRAEIPDHINHDPTDNRRENLRLANQSKNTANASLHGDSTSGYKGVWYRTSGKRRKRWASEIVVHRHKLYLGTFHTKQEAALAYNRAAKKYFGEFANPNPLPD